MIDRSAATVGETRSKRARARRFIDRHQRGEIYAYMPAVPPTNICHVIYEPGITLCPIYYILCYVDGLAILSRSARTPVTSPKVRAPRCGDHRPPILSLIAAFPPLSSFPRAVARKTYFRRSL